MNSNVLFTLFGISLILLLQKNFINADGGDADDGGDPDEDGPSMGEPDDTNDESLPDESLPDSAANDNEDDEGPPNGHHGQVGTEHLTAKLKQMAKTLKKMGQGLMSFLGTLGH